MVWNNYVHGCTLLAEVCFRRERHKRTVNVILLHNKIFCLSISPVLETVLVILVFEYTSVTFCFMSDVGAVNCFAFDNIAQAVSLS